MPILCIYKGLNHERREWTPKWVKYASFSTKCWFRSNNGNKYQQHILSHFGQHLIPIWNVLTLFQYIKIHNFSAFTIFSHIFFNLIATQPTPFKLLSFQEMLILRVNHRIWIHLCPLTPNWYLRIWWRNKRIRIIQLIQITPYHSNHLLSHFIPHKFMKKEKKKENIIFFR